MTATLEDDVRAVLTHIDAIGGEGRIMVGVAGPPGSGKSTLAEALVAALNARAPHKPIPGGPPFAALLPMDGFHLDNSVLDQMGLRARKGAPETFDAQGFVGLIAEVRSAGGDVLCPVFDRSIDAVIPNAQKIDGGTRIVVVEGNYLLLRSDPWRLLKPLFDTTVLLAPTLATLERRLIERWLNHGHDREAAERRARGNDLVNARLVLAESAPADLTVDAV